MGKERKNVFENERKKVNKYLQNKRYSNNHKVSLDSYCLVEK